MGWLDWLNQLVYHVTIHHLIVMFIFFLVFMMALSLRHTVSRRELDEVRRRLEEAAVAREQIQASAKADHDLLQQEILKIGKEVAFLRGLIVLSDRDGGKGD